MSTRHRRTFSFWSKKKENQPLDESSQQTVKAVDALLQKGDTDTAQTIINTLIRKFPQNADCCWLFGRLCAAQKRYDPAISNFKQCLRLLPSHADCYCSYGAVLYIKEKYDEAEEMYLQCLQLNAINHRCHYNYGQLHMTKGDPIESEKHIITAIELYKEESSYYEAYGELLISLGRYEEAYTQLDKAVKFDPNNDAAYILLAKVYEKMDKIALALHNTRKAIKMNPQRKEYQKYMHDLNLIKSKKSIQFAKQSVDFLNLKAVDVLSSNDTMDNDIFGDVFRNNAESETETNVLNDILSDDNYYHPVITDSKSVRNLVEFVAQTELKHGEDVEETENSEEPPDEWWKTGSGHGTKFSVRQMYGDEDEVFHEMLDAATDTELDTNKNGVEMGNPFGAVTDEVDEIDDDGIGKVNNVKNPFDDDEEFDDINTLKKKEDIFSDLVNDMEHNTENKKQNMDVFNDKYEVKRNDEAKQQKQEVELDGPKKQFYSFLKNCRLEQYFDKLRENDCDDIRDIEYLDDEELLENTVGIKSKIHRKRLAGECRKLKKRMDAFEQRIASNVTLTILWKTLSNYGVVTMNILCKEVEHKSDLEDKFGIDNVKQCELLWKLITTELQSEVTLTETITKEVDENDTDGMDQPEGVVYGQVMDTAR